MKKILINALVAGLVWSFPVCKKDLEAPPLCDGLYGSYGVMVRVATGSPGELGLLKKLADEYGRENYVSVCWIRAGSGESLQLLHDGKADVVMVHAPDAEKRAIAGGWASNRACIGSNEFYIVGPVIDPAGIKNARSVIEAYSLIARKKTVFVSRGDNSGTHKKEMSIWRAAGIVRPDGFWNVGTR